MKTLVIHPKDPSTDFLYEIYKDKDWTVINDPRTSKSALRDAIEAHDKIIMLGHGTEHGLISMYNTYGTIIDSSFVYLLREKECVCIWCNADSFVRKYDLKGFYTGMIISEYDEAITFLNSFKHEDIDISNILFANTIKEHIGKEDMYDRVKEVYKSDTNAIIMFNEQNIYYK